MEVSKGSECVSGHSQNNYQLNCLKYHNVPYSKNTLIYVKFKLFFVDAPLTKARFSPVKLLVIFYFYKYSIQLYIYRTVF